MNRLLTTCALWAFFATAACGLADANSNTKSVDPNALPTAGQDAASKAAAEAKAAAGSASPVDLGKLLGGVSDGPSAEAAKGPLETALASLKGLAGGNAAASATEGTGGAQKLGAGVLEQFGIGPEMMGTITSLLGNPAVTAVIGPMLEQLKSLIN